MMLALFLILAYAGQTYAMQAVESLSYDGAHITVVNECDHPIAVTFDASRLKDGVDVTQLPTQKEYPGHTSDTVDANTTKVLTFLQLSHVKYGTEKILSSLHISIKSTQPSFEGTINCRNRDIETGSKLVVCHDTGIFAYIEKN